MDNRIELDSDRLGTETPGADSSAHTERYNEMRMEEPTIGMEPTMTTKKFNLKKPKVRDFEKPKARVVLREKKIVENYDSIRTNYRLQS